MVELVLKLFDPRLQDNSTYLMVEWLLDYSYHCSTHPRWRSLIRAWVILFSTPYFASVFLILYLKWTGAASLPIWLQVIPFFNHLMNKTSIFTVLIFLMFVFIFFTFHAIILCKPLHHTWTLMLLYKITMENFDVYRKSVRPNTKRWQNFFIGEVDSKKFGKITSPLPEFHVPSKRFRLFLIGFQVYADRFFWLLMLHFYVVFSGFMIYYTVQIFPLYDKEHWSWPIALINYVLAVISLSMKMICLAKFAYFFFFVWCEIFLYVFYYLCDISRKWAEIQSRISLTGHHLPLEIVTEIRRHMVLLNRMATLDREIVSLLLLFLVSIVLCNNTIMAVSIFFNNTNLHEKILFAWISFFEIICFIFCTFVSAYLHHDIVCIKPALQLVQGVLKSRHLPLKLKIDNHYKELASHSHPLGLTVGSLFTVTYNTILRIVLVYLASVIFILTEIMHLEKILIIYTGE